MSKSTKAIDKELYEKAMTMLESGYRICDISNILGINRSSISNWQQRNGRVEVKQNKRFVEFNLNTIFETEKTKQNYSYILGMYLGNGNIYKCPRTYRITTKINKLDTKASEYTTSIFKEFFTSKTYIIDHTLTDKRNSIEIATHSGKLPLLFPQHSLGKKEDREIKLKDWQEEIIYPIMLIKGLIISSGLLCLQEDTINVKFLHKSSDIVDIFEKYSSLLNFEYKRYIRNNYHIVDIVDFKNDIFLEELRSLKNFSDDSNKLSTCTDKFNENIFEAIDTKEKAYWLGFLYADGNISTKQNRIGFHLAYKDVILLERFCDFVGGNRDRIVSYNNNKTVFYYIHSHKMKDDLSKHNVLPNKTYKDEFPLIEDRELFLAFFLGVYDGDGSEGKSQLTSGNKLFLEHCCKRFDLDKDKIKYLENPYGSCYTLSIGSERFIEVLKNYSYSLERKRITTSQYFPSDESIKFDKDLISLNTCEDCGNIISKRSTKCKSCSAIAIIEPKRKFDVSKEELEKLILEKPMTEIGKMFGVSGNAIKKRCKKLGIELKSMLGHWTKVKYNKI